MPGVSLPAEVLNYLHGYGFDAVQGALNAIGQQPALDWNAAAAIGAACSSFAWSDVEQAWYAFQVGSTAAFRSDDWGRTWTSVTLSTGASDAAFDTSGNAVVLGAAQTLQEGPFVSYGTPIVWTNHAAVLPASYSWWGVQYEPVSATWCGASALVGTTLLPYTSTNRSVWTARAFAAGWTSANANGVTLGVGNGLLVAATIDSTTTFRTMISANGGVTWTNDQAITVNAAVQNLSTALATSRPAWSPTDKLWYIAVRHGTLRKCQVFSSPDGITWTSKAVLANTGCDFTDLVALGSLLIGVNSNPSSVFVSIDQGVTWKRGPQAGIPSAAGARLQTVKSTPNGFGILTGANFVGSRRIGLPSSPAAT